MEKKQDKRIIWQYSLVQILYWGGYGAYNGFQALLFQGRGFSASQIGALLSIRFFAGLVWQPIIGSFADKHPRIPLQRILGTMLVCALGVNLLLILLRPGFALTLLLVLGLGVFELNSASLLNSIALKYIEAGSSLRYSLARGMGSMALAVSGAVMGLLAKRCGVESILITRLAIVGCFAIFVLTLPVCSAHLADDRPANAAAPGSASSKAALQETGPQDAEVHSLWYILKKNPTFSFSMLAVFFAITGLAPLNSYLSIILKSQGGGADLVGYALFAYGMAELPAAVLYLSLSRRFTNERILLFSFLMMGIRVGLTLISPGPGFTIAAQLSQMLGYGLFLPAAVHYTAHSIPSADRVKGQAILMVASGSLAGFCGNMMYGWAFGVGGIDFMLKLSIGCIMLAVVIGGISLRPFQTVRKNAF